jgi:hypothetical protein
MSSAERTYERIRAACCETHGLGGSRNGTFRDNPKLLDEHARAVTKLVLGARELHERSTA